jgi:hypothetical protein
MKEQFHIDLITVSLFVAGLLTGVWTQKTRPIPPPPAPVLGEFGTLGSPGIRAGGYAPGMGGFAIERFSPGHPAAIVTMNRNMAELEPKIREFQGAVDSIEREFREKLDKLLTPEQREKLASIEAEEAPETAEAGPPPPPPLALEGPGATPPPPFPPADGNRRFFVRFHAPFPIGGWLIMSMIIYQPSLEHLTRELKLDPAKQAAVKQLMVERRSDLRSSTTVRPRRSASKVPCLEPREGLQHSRFKAELAPSRFAPARGGRWQGIPRGRRNWGWATGTLRVRLKVEVGE